MIRYTIFLLPIVACWIFISACSKTTTPPPPPPSTAPTIASINPSVGTVNTQVTITGTNFKTPASANTVKFNGVAAAITSASSTTLVVTAPTGGSTGPITVATADGSATGPTFTYQVIPVTVDVYVVGGAYASQGYWKNGVYTALPGDCSVAWSIFVAGSDVYVAGVDNTSAPKYWKNGVGVSLQLTPGNNEGVANSIFVSGSDVYVAGYDLVSGTHETPKCWKNGVDIGLSFAGTTGDASGVFVSGTDVYVSGAVYRTKEIYATITYWKNGVPVYLTDGTNNSFGTGIYEFGGDVYTCGYQDIALAPHSWKNSTPVPVNVPDTNISYTPRSVYVSAGGDVYISGTYRDIAKYWKNGVMVDLTNTPGGQGIFEDANGITGNGNDIYIAGRAYPQGYGYWKNGVFTPLTGATNALGIFVK